MMSPLLAKQKTKKQKKKHLNKKNCKPPVENSTSSDCENLKAC